MSIFKIFIIGFLFALIIIVSLTDNAFAQGAVSGANNAFDGVSDNLRFFLDGIRSIELFFGNLGCHLEGIFLGYEQRGLEC